LFPRLIIHHWFGGLKKSNEVPFIDDGDRESRGLQPHDCFDFSSVAALDPVMTGEFSDHEDIHGLTDSRLACAASRDDLFLAPFSCSAEERAREDELLATEGEWWERIIER
jgi:hypothetical protein